MKMEIQLTDDFRPDSPLVIYVGTRSHAWPELLETFIGAVLAAKFVLSPFDAYDAAITQLTEQRDALARVGAFAEPGETPE